MLLEAVLYSNIVDFYLHVVPFALFSFILFSLLLVATALFSFFLVPKVYWKQPPYIHCRGKVPSLDPTCGTMLVFLLLLSKRHFHATNCRSMGYLLRNEPSSCKYNCLLK